VSDITEPRQADKRPFAREAMEARLHRIQWAPGWEYAQTSAIEGDPFDPDAPPPGEGWMLNVHAGDGGYSTSAAPGGRVMRLVHWKRPEIDPAE
jgi:hypothetical protein